MLHRGVAGLIAGHPFRACAVDARVDEASGDPAVGVVAAAGRRFAEDRTEGAGCGALESCAEDVADAAFRGLCDGAGGCRCDVGANIDGYGE